MTSLMTIVYKAVGAPPEQREISYNGDMDLQKQMERLVGGYWRPYGMNDLLVIANDDHESHSLPPHLRFGDAVLRGNVFVTRNEGADLASLQHQQITRAFALLEEHDISNG